MLNRREVHRVSKLAAAGIKAADAKMTESLKHHADALEAGETREVQASRQAAAKLRKQSEDAFARAAEREAAGKTGAAERSRKVAERAARQAAEWDERAERQQAKNLERAAALRADLA